MGNKEDGDMDLPPGFRFHPTDEELITHYLYKKVIDTGFSARAIGEVDLNKSEPWDLPWKAKMGEKEWYFFCVRDRKYPTGVRTNRATEAGYWKATGKDKEIYRGKPASLVGMKKTLVFYKGRAPRGDKTNWVMHEYRLEGKLSVQYLPKTAKNEWVIGRIFQKTSGGKKIHITGLMRLPQSCYAATAKNVGVGVDVPCFSTCNQQGMIDCFNSNPVYSAPAFSAIDQSNTLRALVVGFKPETASRDTDISSVVSNLHMGKRPFQAPSAAGPVDLDCLWNY